MSEQHHSTVETKCKWVYVGLQLDGKESTWSQLGFWKNGNLCEAQAAQQWNGNYNQLIIWTIMMENKKKMENMMEGKWWENLDFRKLTMGNFSTKMVAFFHTCFDEFFWAKKQLKSQKLVKMVFLVHFLWFYITTPKVTTFHNPDFLCVKFDYPWTQGFIPQGKMTGKYT